MGITRTEARAGRQRLIEWIERSKFASDREAADVLGIHPVVLSQYKTGVRRPDLENAIRIERVAGIAADSWLLNDISDDSQEIVSAVKPTKKTGR